MLCWVVHASVTLLTEVPMYSSMALWPATFTSCSVYWTLCLMLFCLITQAQPAADSHIFTVAPGTQVDSVQNHPPNIQEFFNQPATILQKYSSHVPTIALSPLSQSKNLFCTTNFGKHSFSFSAPTIWNELPAAIRESNTLDTFKRRLKTHLTSLTTRNV